ncbi:methyl-accepting chemotaxis protein [Colwellia sp. Arc7-635]|uniref:methyl-accepting chemotaxis protein n=1 Tax=Colwellia sp. Arc7-635 TaxID=2497879 RepID=UPI000F85068A|nr:methyl-accepting chemotaxis protein [Colwellia sp. Arc7-635]AZQ85985.1 methyl-accepting chemotaxis protein [Colwellia sp. Arc7-635]
MTNISIKQKVTLALILFVLLTASLVGALSQWSARSIIEDRMLNKELPNTIKQINGEIDKEISTMRIIAQQIATDPFIQDWFAQGRSAEGEAHLLAKLRAISASHNLSKTSFADRQSGHYWNQEGYLRQLNNDNVDGWFFAYRESGKASSVSIYAYPDSDKIDLFVNYQEVNGKGLAGIAKSFEDIVNLLNRFTLEKTGFVYLVNDEGIIQLHKDKSLVGKSIDSIYSKNITNTMLNKSAFSLEEAQDDKADVFVAASFIPSAQWYVVVQVPQAEVFASLNDTNVQMITWSLLVIIIAIFVALLIAKSITRPIDLLAELFLKLGQGKADISYRIPESGQQELVNVAHGYNQFITKLEDVFLQVSHETLTLKQTAETLQNKANETIASSVSNDENSHHISTALSQISETVSDVAQNAIQASDIASNIKENNDSINQVIHSAKLEVEELGEKIHDVSDVINTLATNSETIAGALAVIQTISDQTNLLALNAAIEAARAGEHGRGFSVVADEVRTLASKTVESTAEIQAIMKILKETSSTASKEITQIIEQSASTTQSIAKAEDILQVSLTLTEQILDSNHLVATATEEQAFTITDINNNMSNITDVAKINMNNVQEIVDNANVLNQLAENLDNLIVQFKAEKS